jgi:Domain of unknown function (DUF4932)
MKRFALILILLLNFNLFAQTKKTEIVNPEFFELVQIAYSLTEFSKTNEYMTDKSSKYFAEVQTYFAPQANHPIVFKLSDAAKKDYSSYISNRNRSLDFSFENNKLKESDVIPPIQKFQAKYLGDAFADLTLWEDFAEKSKFREFFAKHKEFYQQTLAETERNLPLEKIQTWLEREFPERYDRYKIVISPLIGGTHSTFRANFQSANQCFMFVSDANGYDTKKLSPKQIEGLFTGVVFTEIDHNYNNPVSAKLSKEIEKAMPDTAKWSNGAEAKGGFYKSALKIFDEYTTHSLYLLYIYDNFSAKDYEVIRDSKVSQMINRRGFAKFKEFHEEFLRLYKARKQGEKLADLYPNIVDWVARQ